MDRRASFIELNQVEAATVPAIQLRALMTLAPLPGALHDARAAGQGHVRTPRERTEIHIAKTLGGRLVYVPKEPAGSFGGTPARGAMR